jgi:hypothetical protein
VQAVLSRGDDRIAGLLAAIDNVSLAEWRQKARELEIDLGHYTVEKWETDAELPWDFIDSGNAKEKLALELNRALSVL